MARARHMGARTDARLKVRSDCLAHLQECVPLMLPAARVDSKAVCSDGVHDRRIVKRLAEGLLWELARKPPLSLGQLCFFPISGGRYEP